MDFKVYFSLAIMLYVVGLCILISKRNVIKMIMGIEIMLFASNFMFVSISAFISPGMVDPLARAIVIISMVIGAAIAAIMISLAIYAARLFKTTDVRKLSELKG
ncbi:MAG: NADH-quinone oxidoreductase subunit NuoK [Candidatus Njordarchaeia archaeon]